MSKQFLAVLAAIVLVFIGVVAFTGNKDNSSGGKGGAASKASVTQHITGKLDSSVTLVEYGDYQCPYCEQYYTTVKQVTEVNKEKIRFQFRNFPLNSIHQNAFAAARAAEAAGLQNKYWEMHDLLYGYQNWQVWTKTGSPQSLFNDYAKELGLNVTQFKTDFASEKVNNMINADMAEGNRLGITGTPTFFLNGKQIQVANDPAAFQKLIDTELAKHQASASSAANSTTSTSTTSQ